MYTSVAEMSRAKASNSRLLPSWFRVPGTKLRNVVCVLCRSKFYVPDLSNLNGLVLKGTLIPLLLECGHPICNKCIRKERLKTCPMCKTDLDNGFKRLLPLNLYTLGLIVSSYHRPLENDDEEFLFCHKLSTQLRQIAKQGCCHECGNQANVNCPQCMVLYCYCCYSKIHGRALQNHSQIPIHDGGSGNPADMLNSCSPTCSEMLGYFCNDCSVACCSNCTLLLHKLHNFVALSEKNQTLLPEFNETYMHIQETLLRVCQTKEKIKSAIASNTYKVQNSEIIEASIAEHFAYLHGVLKNMEARLMNQLHEQSDYLKNNLEDIERQLAIQEEKLKITLQIASYAKQTFHKMDIRNAINILKEMADLPCHLMYKDACQNQIATFTVDDSIVAAIEDHCSITVPLMSSYSLVRKDELPKNYIMSPLSKKLRAMVFDEPPSMLPEMQPSKALVALPPTTIIDDKTEDNEQEESISEYKVEVTYVINPSFFFVRKLSTKPEFLQLEKDVTAYGNSKKKNLDEEPSINIEQDDMCVVKQWKADEWYRGRVNAVSTTADGERVYNVIYIDYGYEECNIAASRVREIAEHLRELPPQAIRCSLHGLLPKNLHWTNASTNDFLKLTNGADCTMSIFNSTRDVLYVDLRFISKNSNMGPQSMCSTMKIMDHARLNTRLSPKHGLKTATTYVYTKEDLLLSKMTTVDIGWIESPDKIYVVKSMRQNKFLKIRSEMNEYFEKETSPNIIETPQEGLPCAVQLEDNTWQRGEITEIINENQVRVFCVDWGYTLIQNRDTLRAIPHEYTIFKAQAIKVTLMYIMAESDGSWKPEAISSLLNIFNNANCITIIPRRKLDDGYIGCMYADNIDISRQLKDAGVVNEFFMSSKFKIKPKKLRLAIKPTIPLESDNNPKSDNTIKDLSVSCNDTQVEDDNTVKDETPKDPFKVEVRVQRVTTPDCIYVAQTEYEKSNAKLMAAMQKFYNAYFSEPRDNWSEGALCAVYSAKDKSYFRAKILKIISLTEVLVYFYDMGIEETVTMKDIQVLHSKFAKEMTYCFKVKLAGILPCGGSSTWPKLSCDTLSEIIRGNAKCKFYITKPVQEEICDDVVSVELWVRQVKIPGPLARAEVEINSINRMLVEKGVALPIKNYFAKADSTLATEFRQQLENSCWFVHSEEEVKWLNKGLNETKMDETLMSPKDELSFCNSSIDVLTTLASNAKYQACESTDRECAVKFSDWLPPTEITEEVFHAIPTYVDNKCAVYLHSKKYNADVLHYIETELQTHYKYIKINKDKQWKEGELCIAQYHGNQKWYRGKVIKTSGNVVQVEFVDYGNVEDCEMEHVTDHVRLGHIPIQCTKCVISGLKPVSPNGKWMLHDLDRIHALLVDKECKVSILQRQPTYLIISIQLLQPWKCDFLVYLANHLEMNVKIERKEWNDSDNSEDEGDNLKSLDTTRDVVIEETVSEYEKLPVADTSNRSSGTYTQDVTLIEDMISGNLTESLQTELLDKLKIKISDTESISSIDTNILNNHLICSTPQPQSEEEDGVFLSYKQLTIPQETKYIEIKLCCNKDPITSFAQLAENNDHMFSDELHKYYLWYEIIMSELQTDARHQPLLESFEKNTPCITKFIDDMWYRCVITNSEKIPNSQYIKISLYYVDFGNHEYRILDLLSEDHNLYAPKQKWLELPAIAIKCTFWGLNFVSDDIDLLASKLDEIYNQAVVAQIKEINDGNNLVVQIYKDKTCRELFYAHLIEEGLYQFKKPKED